MLVETIEKKGGDDKIKIGGNYYEKNYYLCFINVSWFSFSIF